ncbi:MAG TPA: mechanosensitive ion channel domain-containing protein [Ktedonobacteraceae bacterium]|nr:mechanosensitive ion channel domain-containing protein [Ktedonobacteraceae bacterium]
MTMTSRIVLTVFIGLLALIIGLLLRLLLVRRLKQTVLDNWLIQTLGVIVVLVPLIIAGAATPFILDSTNGNWKYLNSSLQKLISNPTNLAPLVWSVVQPPLVLVLGVGIARTLSKLALRNQSHLDINLRTLISRICYIITLLITGFWILTLLQISVTVPVAVIGSLAVAGAFAIQDILKDLVAGFYILMERPFHIGDEINTASYVGKVEDIQIRATKLRLVSGEQVTIPNSMVFGGVVVNNTYYGERRATITVTMPQEEYKRKETPELILKALQEIDAVMVKPEPMAFISGYAGKLVTLTVRFWIANRQLATVSEVMYTLRTVLPNADFTVLESAGNV